MPESTPLSQAWLRRAAVAAGLVAALTLTALGRMPAGAAEPGVDATVTTGPTGQLAVAPVGTVAGARGLRPGHGRLVTHVTITNQTAAPLALRVRARPSIADADRSLHVRVRAAGAVLYDGPAGGLRSFSRGSARVAAGADAVLEVSAWVPAQAGGGWNGRAVTLPIEYRTKVIGERGA